MILFAIIDLIQKTAGGTVQIPAQKKELVFHFGQHLL